MKKFRIYAASCIFIALTAVKLIMPAPAARIRSEVSSVIMRSDDYSQAVQTIGEKLSLASEPAAGPAATQVPEIETVSPAPSAKAAETPVPTETTAPADEAKTQSETAKAVPEAVQVFLDSQKQYSDYSVPANVSYSFDSLPFIYQPPVKGVSSSGFGYRMHPIEKVVKFHYGTDFAAQSGDAIYAFADGTVKTAAEDEGYGKYLVISHPGGYETLYAHCGSLLVSRGETVKMGDRIAAVGQTGKATGPHLHFELIKSGVYLNPEFYL